MNFPMEDDEYRSEGRERDPGLFLYILILLMLLGSFLMEG